MKIRPRSSLPLILLAVQSTAGLSQGAPGTNLSADVRLSSIEMLGDTAKITYVVTNRVTSRERLVFFTVDAPSEPLEVGRPGPKEAWAVFTSSAGRSVADWAALNAINQGSSSPPLWFRAVGLPGIVSAWYRGDSLSSIGEDGSEGLEPDPSVPVPAPPPEPDPLTDLSVETRTVGVDAIPSDATAADLTARLDDLTAQSCALGWITQASLCSTLRGHLAAQPARLAAFRSDVTAGHTVGGPVTDNAYWLLKVNADYLLSLTGTPAPASQLLFLHGSGGTANPPTLFLDGASPAGTTVKYKDSPAIQFAGGNPWKGIGSWIATPSLVNGDLTAVGGAEAWIGLRNSDDIGTNFDLRAELYKNGTLVTSGETLCIQGVTSNPTSAKKVVVSFAPFPATSFNGTTDVLSLKELTRVGTNAAGGHCGGHTNAVGLRSYFDATTRAAAFSVSF